MLGFSERKRQLKSPIKMPGKSFRFRRKAHGFLILLAVALLVGEEYEARLALPALVYQGAPAARHWAEPKSWFRVLRNEGFTIGYSDLRGNPLWVVYRLLPIPRNAPGFARPERFSRDWRNLTLIGQEDYSGSGFDRGHLAPNYAIGRLHGKRAQEQTFLMTNVSPQRPNLNRKVWQRLEEVAADHFTARFGRLWVVTGPVFDANIERLRSSVRVEVPDAFYKIFAVPADEKSGSFPSLLAFIIPQSVRGNEPLDRFLVSVDEVERRTGFDFFPELDDAIEAKIEGGVDPEKWNLKHIARLPARY